MRDVGWTCMSMVEEALSSPAARTSRPASKVTASPRLGLLVTATRCSARWRSSDDILPARSRRRRSPTVVEHRAAGLPTWGAATRSGCHNARRQRSDTSRSPDRPPISYFTADPVFSRCPMDFPPNPDAGWIRLRPAEPRLSLTPKHRRWEKDGFSRSAKTGNGGATPRGLVGLDCSTARPSEGTATARLIRAARA